MKRQYRALILCVLCLSVRLRAQQTPAASALSLAAAHDAASGAIPRFAREIAALTNAKRAAVGLPPLKLQENLQISACWLARDMAQKNYFSHTDKQGRDIDPRLPACGYSGYHSIGENIAAGQETPADAMAGWMKSPGHRENILSPNYNEIGVGYSFSDSSEFLHYWVQDFGSRFDFFPVVINNEQPTTKDPLVHLYLYGADWARQMRFSSDGVAWTPWEPYVSARDWKLEEGSGERFVYVELKNSDGLVRADKDSITLLPQSQSKIH